MTVKQAFGKAYLVGKGSCSLCGIADYEVGGSRFLGKAITPQQEQPAE